MLVDLVIPREAQLLTITCPNVVLSVMRDCGQE